MFLTVGEACFSQRESSKRRSTTRNPLPRCQSRRGIASLSTSQCLPSPSPSALSPFPSPPSLSLSLFCSLSFLFIYTCLSSYLHMYRHLSPPPPAQSALLISIYFSPYHCLPLSILPCTIRSVDPLPLPLSLLLSERILRTARGW